MGEQAPPAGGEPGAAMKKLRNSVGNVASATKVVAAAQEQHNADMLQLNDEVVDMLSVLNYETEFCDKELRPMSRCFFVYTASNQAQQFKYFTQLVSWLLKKAGSQATWQKYDDPNTVCTSMLVAFKELGLQGVDVPPQKLKQGSGEGVCQVLHNLLKEVLKRIDFEFGNPEPPDEAMADEAEVDDDAEVNSVGEEGFLEDQEEDLMYNETTKKKGEESMDADEDDGRGLLEAKVDPRLWQLEVERVSSKLKIQMPSDAKEWRTHLQQTKGYKEQIESSFPDTKSQLEKLSRDLGSMMERIRGKEAFINSQFDNRALDYRTQQQELQQVTEKYDQLKEVVMGLQIELKSATEEEESVKAELEERSTQATDTAPIVKLKDAFKKMRQDTRQLEVRIGVVCHTLMQAKLRVRPDQQRNLYPGSGGTDHYDEAPDA